VFSAHVCDIFVFCELFKNVINFMCTYIFFRRPISQSNLYIFLNTLISKVDRLVLPF